MKTIKLNSPKDVREQIRIWISEACNTGKLPFEGAGSIVQLLNVWLRAFELDEISDIEERLDKLEKQRGANNGRGIEQS